VEVKVKVKYTLFSEKFCMCAVGTLGPVFIQFALHGGVKVCS
jgi:hypothetical protein